jgi:Protein of unknown function (DUF1583)/WD40-like Beta Propeller Repeat
VYRLLETEEISDRPSVPDGLHFHTMCSGAGETSVIWKSFTLRAERLSLKPDPNAKPQVNLFTMKSDGTDIRLLAKPRPGFTQLGSFEWSADGKKLIGDTSQGDVEMSRIPFLEQFRIWIISGVDYSPDGKTIAFTASTPPATIEWPLE